MQIGIDSFIATLANPVTGALYDPVVRLQNLLEEIETADLAGLDVFGIGEHHREEFLDSAPVVILAAAAARTKRIRLASAVTVLSAADPVRVFQEFATLDLLSQGRAEIVAGRGSFTEAYPLFGFDLRDYDSLFTEKLDLLLKIRDSQHVTWSGRHRPPLRNQAIHPRPAQNPLPVWIGVGGTPASFVRAGTLGLPLMVAIIGGEPHRFRPLVERYREAGRRAGHAPEKLKVGHPTPSATWRKPMPRRGDDYFPGYARMFTEIGIERGWPPVTRDHFEALLGPTGALIIGNPQTVADKILHIHESLGGIDRINLQMSPGTLPHATGAARDRTPGERGRAAGEEATGRMNETTFSTGNQENMKYKKRKGIQALQIHVFSVFKSGLLQDRQGMSLPVSPFSCLSCFSW